MLYSCFRGVFWIGPAQTVSECQKQAGRPTGKFVSADSQLVEPPASKSKGRPRSRQRGPQGEGNSWMIGSQGSYFEGKSGQKKVPLIRMIGGRTGKSVKTGSLELV